MVSGARVSPVGSEDRRVFDIKVLHQLKCFRRIVFKIDTNEVHLARQFLRHFFQQGQFSDCMVDTMTPKR